MVVFAAVGVRVRLSSVRGVFPSEGGEELEPVVSAALLGHRSRKAVGVAMGSISAVAGSRVGLDGRAQVGLLALLVSFRLVLAMIRPSGTLSVVTVCTPSSRKATAMVSRWTLVTG